MGRTIIVDPAKLQAAATQMGQITGDYQKQYNRLFSEVDGLGAAWQGIDNQAFVNQIKGFTDDFNQMVALLNQYAEFLKSSAQTYTSTQNNIADAAKRLQN